MDPNKPIVLRGENLKIFERYQKSKPTKEEVALLKLADKYYRDSIRDPSKNHSMAVRKRKAPSNKKYSAPLTKKNK